MVICYYNIPNGTDSLLSSYLFFTPLASSSFKRVLSLHNCQVPHCQIKAQNNGSPQQEVVPPYFQTLLLGSLSRERPSLSAHCLYWLPKQLYRTHRGLNSRLSFRTLTFKTPCLACKSSRYYKNWAILILKPVSSASQGLRGAPTETRSLLMLIGVTSISLSGDFSSLLWTSLQSQEAHP